MQTQPHVRHVLSRSYPIRVAGDAGVRVGNHAILKTTSPHRGEHFLSLLFSNQNTGRATNVEYHVRHTNLNEIDDVYNQEVFDSRDFTLLSKKVIQFIKLCQLPQHIARLSKLK
jgi:hypothetical protein